EGARPGPQPACGQVGALGVEGEAFRGALFEPGDDLIGRQLLREVEQPVHVTHVRRPGRGRLHLRLRKEVTGRAPLAQDGLVDLRGRLGAGRCVGSLAGGAGEDSAGETREGDGDADGREAACVRLDAGARLAHLFVLRVNGTPALGRRLDSPRGANLTTQRGAESVATAGVTEAGEPVSRSTTLSTLMRVSSRKGTI